MLRLFSSYQSIQTHDVVAVFTQLNEDQLHRQHQTLGGNVAIVQQDDRAGFQAAFDAGDASFTWRTGSVPAGVQQVLDVIIAPTLAALRARGTPFRGLLYCGVMLTPTGPRVVEFNCRFGDPETQAVLTALADDAPLLRVMLQIARGERIDPVPVFAPARSVVATVIAAAGYPGTPRGGDTIALPESDEGEWLFHAGTTLRDGLVTASGGRVLTITARGDTLSDAHHRAYAMIDLLDWPEGFCRSDIGWRAL